MVEEMVEEMGEEIEIPEQVKPEISFNAFVGTDRGVVKGINFANETPICKNFATEGARTGGTQVSSLSWVSENQEEVLVAFDDGKLANLNGTTFEVIHLQHLDVKSLIVAAHETSKGHYVYGLENGKLCLYDSEKDEESLEIQTGKNLCAVKQLGFHSSLFACGGEENDLKLYDLNSTTPSEPVFSARNVRHDFLELRVPVWVQDISFINDSSDNIGICSRHGQVRLYDVKASRRPVIDFVVFEDEGLMSMCDTGLAGQVIVGGNKGSMAMVDIRQVGKGKLVHKFSPATGSVRSIAFKNNYIVSSSIDRHVYLYNMYEKKALKKLYMKTRLTQVLMTDNFSFCTEVASKKFRRSSEKATIVKKQKLI